MFKIKKLFLFFSVILLTSNIYAKDSCSLIKEAIAEEKLAHMPRNWNSLFIHWRVFSNCDDGFIADGYSQAGSRLILNKSVKLNTIPEGLPLRNLLCLM